MRLGLNIFDRVKARLMVVAETRLPDVVIGGQHDPYLQRWYILPRNRFLNVYLHKFLRSDDDRALHDHPWLNMSILLDGTYTEHQVAAGGIHLRFVRKAGDWYLRLSGKLAHRIQLTHGVCWTLFITGPRYREWGFHCTERGWVHWEDFTASDDRGAVGKGCDQ